LTHTVYNTPDTGCLECYRLHTSVNTTTPKIDRKHVHYRNMLEIRGSAEGRACRLLTPMDRMTGHYA